MRSSTFSKLASNKVHGNKVHGVGVGGGLPDEEDSVLLATFEVGEPVQAIEFIGSVAYNTELELSFTNLQVSKPNIAVALGLQFKGQDWDTDYSLSLMGTETIVKRENWESLLLTNHMPLQSINGQCLITGLKRNYFKSATFQTFVDGRDTVASFHGGGKSNVLRNERLTGIRLLVDPLRSDVLFTRGFIKLYGRKDK